MTTQNDLELETTDIISNNIDEAFGIEIECLLPELASIESLINILTVKGIDVQTEYYNHGTKTYWKIITDSSVHTNSDNYQQIARELVSPILRGQQDKNKIKIICKALEEIGANTNSSCGFHVHYNATNLGVQDIKNLINIYANHEEEIDNMVAKIRRGSENRYCQSVKTIVSRVSDQDTIAGMVNSVSNRNVKLNLIAYNRHNTIEFRQYQGTIDSDEILAWIDFCFAIVNWAKNGPKDNDINLFDGLQFSEEQREYWNNQIENYKKRED